MILIFIKWIKKLACQPPHHKGRRSRSGGAPGEREGERGRRESRRMNGGWSSLVSHRKGRKDRKGSYCTGFASFALFAVQYITNNIFQQQPAANKHNFHSALRDRRIPIHPQGSTKAPASPHITSADWADRHGHPGGGKVRGGAAGEPKRGRGLELFQY